MDALDGRPVMQDVEQRRQSVLRLKDIPDGVSPREFARLLVKAMQDTSWRVRKAAIGVLLENYPLDAYVDGLIGLLHLEDNAGARNSAIEALTALGAGVTKHLVEDFQRADEDVRKFIVEILGAVKDGRSVPLLIDALKDEDDNVRASAVEQLGSIREPAVVDALVGILRSGDLWTAYAAVEALGNIGDPKAEPALLEALENRTLREPVLRALGKVSGEGAVEKIVPHLEDRSRAIRQEALTALAMIYQRGAPGECVAEALSGHFGQRATEALLGHMENARHDSRAATVMLLGLLKDERAFEPLLALTDDDEVSDQARKALVFITRHKPESLLRFFGEQDIFRLRAIASVAAEAPSLLFFDALCGLTGCPDGHVRAYAAAGLSEIGDPAGVASIRGLLSDNYPDVQKAAIKALVLLKDHLDLDELEDYLHSGEPALRKGIAMLLGEIGSSRSVGTLGSSLKDEDVEVRRAAVSSLAGLKTPDAVSYLRLALSDEDPGVRLLATHALGGMDDESSIEPLVYLISDGDDRVRAAAIKALGAIGKRDVVPMLIEALSSGNGLVVTAAMEALGSLGGEEARRALRAMLFSEDREFRRTAIRSLSSFDDIEHVLINFLRDEDWATRVSAIEALSVAKSDSARLEIEALYEEERDPVVKKALETFLHEKKR